MKLPVGIRNTDGHTLTLSNSRLTHSRYAHVTRQELKMAFRTLDYGSQVNTVTCVTAQGAWHVFRHEGFLHVGCCKFSTKAEAKLRRWAMDGK